jgi:hypothetical protein
LYPPADIEGFFGIQMTNDNNAKGISKYPTGALVYNAWVFIFKSFLSEYLTEYSETDEDRARRQREVAEATHKFSVLIRQAIIENRLPEFFQSKCEKYKDEIAYGRRYFYLVELIRREYANINKWRTFQPPY